MEGRSYAGGSVNAWQGHPGLTGPGRGPRRSAYYKNDRAIPKIHKGISGVDKIKKDCLGIELGDFSKIQTRWDGICLNVYVRNIRLGTLKGKFILARIHIFVHSDI
jgi:hypothetical protein